METSVKITEEKLRASEMVEVIVETEAQAGMSGISISGGGRDGLFISDVIKDSPAAKNLSLLQGDQIISARVFFENIKYEDALRILEYAEQYKVSYCLKRTVPSSDVTVSPSSGSVEVKGPKAKMPKLTVKSLTPVKKKKKKVPSQVTDSEVSMEAVKGSEFSAASLDIPPVDVEFSFPKFSKILKSKGSTEATTGTKSTEITTKVTTTEQKRLRMKFPRLRVKDAAAGGGVSVDVSKSKDDSTKSQDDVKMKEKSATQFGVSVPKIKKPKVDVTVAKPDIEIAAPKIEIAAPKIGTGTKDEKVFKTPQVELDIPLTNMKSETETSERIKAPGLSTSIKIPDVEIKMPVTSAEIETPEAKISMPFLSKVGICTPQLEKEQDVSLLIDGRPKTEIKLPSLEIAAPKLDVDLSLPKVDGSVEVETPDSTGRGLQIKLPKFSMSTKTTEVTPPQVKKEIKGKVSEEKVKMPSVKSPQLGISLPKGKLEGDSPDSQKRSSLKFPSIDISAPKLDLDLSVESNELSVEPFQVPDVSLKMPKISTPKVGMKVKDAYTGTISQTDVKSEKVETESTIEIPDVTLKMPKIGLPKLGLKNGDQDVELEMAAQKSEHEEFKLKSPKLKLPSLGGFLGKEKSEVDGSDSSLEAEGKLKFPSIKMPSIDISLPKLQDSESSKLEGSMPAAKIDKKAPELEATDLKFKMPKVSLPKFDVTTKLGKPDMSPPKFGIHMPTTDRKIKSDKLKEDKIISSDLDISVPKTKTFDLHLPFQKPDLGISGEKPKVAMKFPKVELESIAFDGQTGDSKVGIPSIKMPVLEIDAPSLDVDLNLPKVKTEGTEISIEDKDSIFQMPKLNLPKLSDVAKDLAVELDVPKVTGDICPPYLTAEMKTGIDTEEKGLKVSFPKVEIGLGKSTEFGVGEIKEKAEVKFPKLKQEKIVVEDEEAKIRLPSVKLPSLEIDTPKIPDVDIAAGIPTVELDVSGKEDLEATVSGDVDAKWKAPKFYFRKLGIAGSKAKKGEVDAKTTDTEGDTGFAVKGPKLKMPKFGIVFPKSKQDDEVEVDKKASKAKVDASAGQVDSSLDGKVKVPSVKLPSFDISAPKLEVDIALPKGDTSTVTDKSSEINIDIPDVKLNLPKFSMPKFGKSKEGSDIEKTKVQSKISPSKSVKASEASGELDGKSAEAKGKGRELKMKMPIIKMPSFGISKKDTDVSEAKIGVSYSEEKTKKSKTVAQEAKVSLETEGGDGKTSFIKMPIFKMSSPKVKAPEVDLTLKGSKENIQMPDVHIKVPEVELPSFGIKSDRTAEVSLSKVEAIKSVKPKDTDLLLSDKIKIPSLEIAAPSTASALQISAPCVKPGICTSIPKVEVDVTDVDIKRYGGDLKIPTLPSIGVSVPDVELDLGLPKVSLEHEAHVRMEKSSAKLKMPKVELTKLEELEAKVDISSVKSKDIEYEGKIKGPKLKLPSVDISLPKVKLDDDDDDIPFIESDFKMHGSSTEVTTTEGFFSLPAVELPKMSTPKIRAPELELDISLSKEDLKGSDYSKPSKVESSGSEGEQHDLKLKMPKIKMPKFGGSMTGVEEGKTGAKASKSEDSSESGIKGFKIKMPKLQVGSLKGKGGEDREFESDHKIKMAAKSDLKVSDHEDSDSGHTFKIKMPSFGISKGTAEAGTEPLHPPEESTEFKIKMPKITLPDVGFSGGEGEKISLESGYTDAVSKVKSITSSNIEELELDVGLKMPKIKMPTISLPGRKGDDDMEISLDEESEGKRSLFKMPDVELSTPKMKAHGEYEMDGAKVEQKRSKELEGGDAAKKSSKIKDERKHDTAEEDAEKKYKIKLPKLAVSLPKAVAGDVELSPPKLKSETKDSDISMKGLRSEQESDQHEGKKTKKNIFSLGKTKDKSGGLISSDVDTSLEFEGPELKIKLPKIKMKPSFGRSKGKGKGSEVNGEEETDADSSDVTAKSSKIKFPKLGFSSSKGNSGDLNINGTSGHVNGETEVSAQNGSQDGFIKVGKLKFPKVEFSSPYKGKEIDSEMNLKLVKKEEPESKDEGTESSFSSKFKSPKIAFSGFKKKEKGEDHIISSPARTEMAIMENVKEGESKSGMGRLSLGFLSSKSKGEYTVDNSGIQKDNDGDSGKDKSTKYKIPKLSLNSKLGAETEFSKEIKGESSQESFEISLPQVSFTTHQEEETTTEEETTLGFLKVTTTKQIKTETVTEKTLAI